MRTMGAKNRPALCDGRASQTWVSGGTQPGADRLEPAPDDYGFRRKRASQSEVLGPLLWDVKELYRQYNTFRRREPVNSKFSKPALSDCMPGRPSRPGNPPGFAPCI